MNSGGGGYWVSETLVAICCGEDEHVFNRNPSPDSVLFSTANMEKSVERSFQDQHLVNDEFSKTKKISAVASSKLGVARCSNKDKLVGLEHRFDKSQQQSNITQVNKLHQGPVMKSKLQKTAGAGPGTKNPSYNKLRSKDPITEGVPSYNLRCKLQKTEDRNASVNSQNRKTPKKDSSKDSSVTMQNREILKNFTKPIKKIETPNPVTASPANIQNRKTPKKDGSKDSSIAMQKRGILKNSTKPIKKIETPKPVTASPANIQNRKTLRKDSSKDSSVAVQKREILRNSTKPIKRIETPKPLTASPADLDRKNHPLASQHKLFSREPIFHIRWEGDVENGPLGHSCVLCNKDLSRATEDDDYDSEYNDDFQYDVGDEYYDEYDHNPPLLPAVDILSCGHAYHTDCLQQGTLKEESSDPQCIVCYRTRLEE